MCLDVGLEGRFRDFVTGVAGFWYFYEKALRGDFYLFLTDWFNLHYSRVYCTLSSFNFQVLQIVDPLGPLC